jgi:hypothetical protein
LARAHAAKAHQRCHLADGGNLFFGLVAKEELGCDRPRSDGVDGNLVAAQFVREYVN